MRTYLTFCLLLAMAAGCRFPESDGGRLVVTGKPSFVDDATVAIRSGIPRGGVGDWWYLELKDGTNTMLVPQIPRALMVTLSTNQTYTFVIWQSQLRSNEIWLSHVLEVRDGNRIVWKKAQEQPNNTSEHIP